MKNLSTASSSKLDLKELTKVILKNLNDNKADNVLNIDLSNKSDLCQTMIIASGTSSRHASSLADSSVALQVSGGATIDKNTYVEHNCL